MSERILMARYFNANGYACAVVAVVNEGVDWAAYMGGCSAEISEDEACDFVSRYGCKLSETDARYFFDFLIRRLPYRGD